MSNRRLLVVVLVIAASFLAARADDARSWLKFHESVRFGEETVGEYTKFMTHDQIGIPAESKTLYRDEEGMLFVVRNEALSETGAGAIVVKALSSGETLVIDMVDEPDSQITVTLGTDSVSFADAEQLPADVKTSGASLLANASPGFRDGLRRMAIVGSYYSTEFAPVGFLLRELFFPDLEVPQGPPPGELTSEPTDVIVGFDPAVHSPGPFDVLFGGEYSLD
jgi:hypothetical protein